jgi:hypothetical protein
VEAIDAGDGLQEPVLAEAAVHVEHRVAGLVEAGEQHADDDEEFDAVPLAELGEHAPLVAVESTGRLHRVFPEGLDEGLSIIVFQVGTGFGMVRRGNDDGRVHAPVFFEVLLHAHGVGLAGHSKLGLQARVLPVVDVMVGNVVGDTAERLFSDAQALLVGGLALEVGLLGLAHFARHAVERVVELGLLHILLGMATLVQEWCDGAVLYRLVDGVLVDDTSKLARRVLLLLRERRTGEANVAGVGEGRAHLGVEEAVLRAVALVDQHEDVVVLVAQVTARLAGALELVDDRGDDPLAWVFDQTGQVLAGLRPRGLHAAMLEGRPELLVERRGISRRSFW